MDLMKQVVIEMKKYQFKRTDVKHGELISADRHIEAVKQRFRAFQNAIYEVLKKTFDKWAQKFYQMISVVDQNDR